MRQEKIETIYTIYTKGFGEEGGGTSREVRQQMSRDLFPLYQQAAEQTGFAVEVIAQEGETFSFEHRDPETGGEEWTTVTVSPGNIAASIRSPGGQEDFEAFWKAKHALTAASSGSES